MIIAIGGPSNAGKSLLAENLSSYLEKTNNTILSQDDFVFPENTLPRIKDHIDWEHPSTIDITRLKYAINLAEKEVDNIIIEGFLVYAFPELISLYQKNLFLSITEKTFFQRKQNDLRWGREPDWYIRHIWQSFQKYGQPPKNLPILFLNGDNPWPAKEILKFLNKK